MKRTLIMICVAGLLPLCGCVAYPYHDGYYGRHGYQGGYYGDRYGYKDGYNARQRGNRGRDYGGYRRWNDYQGDGHDDGYYDGR